MSAKTTNTPILDLMVAFRRGQLTCAEASAELPSAIALAGSSGEGNVAAGQLLSFGTLTAPGMARPKEAPEKSNTAGATEPDLDRIVRRVLGLSESASLDGAGIGVTPGWDSLRHIELVLQVEQTFGVSISSQDFEATKTLGQFRTLVQGRTR